MRKSIILGVTFALGAGVLLRAGAQGQGQLPSQFPLSLGLREKGSSLTGAFEGWYHDRDGSVRLLVGYLNRNTKQEFDIPVGPNNHIDPGGPDQGQPTHFQAGRQWGIFTIKVPKDFGDKKLTWTLVANGFTNTITLHSKPEYVVEPFEDAASKNTPPVIRFEPNGKTFTGPPSAIGSTLSVDAGRPLAIDAWVTDEGPKVNPIPAGLGFPQPPPAVKWSLYRGPAPGGSVPAATFEPANPKIDKDSGKARTTVTFAVAGEYVLRMQANDSTGEGGGGFQCCWTNAHVKVTVRNATGTAGTGALPAVRTSGAAAKPAVTLADFAPFMGEWTLGLSTPQGAMNMNLTLKDQDGRIAGQISSNIAPQPQDVTDISKDGDSLVLKYVVNFNGQSVPTQITLVPDGDHWKASFDFAGGQFVLDGTAAKK
jgi:hypothetical protein